MTPESRLHDLGIEIPTPVAPIANYVPYVRTGNLLVISGQIPVIDGKIAFTGKLGGTASIEHGTRAAERCFINLLAQVKAACGDLGHIAKLVRLGGFIACTPDFTQHALVMNGASDLAVAVFGDAGRHARSTIGVASLPGDASVEVEAIFEVLA